MQRDKPRSTAMRSAAVQETKNCSFTTAQASKQLCMQRRIVWAKRVMEIHMWRAISGIARVWGTNDVSNVWGQANQKRLVHLSFHFSLLFHSLLTELLSVFTIHSKKTKICVFQHPTVINPLESIVCCVSLPHAARDAPSPLRAVASQVKSSDSVIDCLKALQDGIQTPLRQY
eukprot:INCI9894.1.p1 GENE.INCI9894.1~~INCI9894.1.p1  ORF type:complete len:173 (+),score=19.94 INCI9894.1:158-676(+)